MGSHINGDGAATRQILDELRRLVRALRVTAREVERDLGISSAQLFVLHALRERAAPASVNDLAVATHTDQSSVSVVVQRLAQRGLVARGASKVDARRTEVRLTAAGRALLRKSPEPTQTQLVDAVEALPRTTRDQLLRGLGGLVREMGLSGAPAMFFEEESPRARQKAKRARG